MTPRPDQSARQRAFFSACDRKIATRPHFTPRRSSAERAGLRHLNTDIRAAISVEVDARPVAPVLTSVFVARVLVAGLSLLGLIAGVAARL